MSPTNHNKQTNIALHEPMFNDCQPAEALARYVGDEYIQHNPHVRDGQLGFLTYFLRMQAEYPGKHVHIVRAVAEADLVVLHCHQTWPGGHDYAGIDIFRFDAIGKIVEHWDVLQVVPEMAQNENTMF
ncbi:nuclear transport factor 2 family protein [Hymenobacter antarcticus]|uniref:Nuclear transport factor 2 family protein n=1 Tax=Hymenobacter antarcticus TaxID=486270 RepID=A0ABP7QDH3_9BACT